MKQIVSCFLMIVVCLSLQSCSTIKGTAQGFQQDVKALVHHTTNKDGMLFKTDRWLQENAW